jgi:histidine ammonia-lyase
VREHVAFVDRDRYMDEDIATAAELIRSGAVAQLVDA